MSPGALVAALALLVVGAPPEGWSAPAGPRPPAERDPPSRGAPVAAVPDHPPGGVPSPRPDHASRGALEGTAIVRVGGASYVSATELARLLDASKFWRPETRKLVLRAHGHRLTVTVGLPFAIVDDRTWLLERPVRSRRGDVLVPVSLLDVLPRDSTLARLVVDEPRGRVLVTPEGGFVGTPRIESDGARTRVAFTTELPADAAVIGRDRVRFRVRVPGTFVGAIPEPPPGGLVGAIRTIEVTAGSAFELLLSPEARGFRLLPESGRVVLELSRSADPGFEPFAPEGPPGPRPMRVVVLDPGHGGADAGVSAGGAAEKDLTLALSALLEREIERRSRARVVRTRHADDALPVEQRAEIANRARADLVLSLHFDGAPVTRVHGTAIYCAPATRSGGAPRRAWSGDAPAGARAIELTPWRDVATRHAVASRALAETIASSLEQRGFGPTRVHERLPLPLLGVDAPGLLIECGVLTSPSDRERLLSSGGLRDLAAAIADGVIAYQTP